MLILITAVAASLIISAGCSLLESVLYSTRAITLEASAARGDRNAKLMRRLRRKVERPLSAILILNTLANTAGAALAGWAAGQVWGASSLWYFSLAFTLAILTFSEILPKTVGAVHWRRLWRLSVWPLMSMIRLTSPLIWLTQVLTGFITKGKDPAPRISEDEILAAARLGASGGEISQLEHELIANIISLEEQRATDIMTPRTVIFSVDGERRVSEVRPEAADWPHTRVPVYLGGPEEFVGYVLKDQILSTDPSLGDEPLKSLATPVRFVPGSANALNLLNSFLRSREHLYLVVDEYGGVQGLVSLEDVLESLVGSEIVDEKDKVADMQEMARKRGRVVLEASREDSTGE